MSDARYRSLEEASTLRLLAQRLAAGFYVCDQEGRLLDANPGFLRLLGIDSLRADLRLADFLVDPSRRQRELALLAQEGSVCSYELAVQRPDGTRCTLLDSCYAVRDEASGDLLYHGLLVDVSTFDRRVQELRELSLRDPLTGCFNRRYLEVLGKRLETDAAPWGALVVDIDQFEQINDRQGHAAGDQLLVRLGRFLERQVRAEDAVVRLAGDAFLVLLVGEQAAATETVAQRIRSQKGESAPVALSLGWSRRQGEEALAQTVERAERHLIRIRHRALRAERRR